MVRTREKRVSVPLGFLPMVLTPLCSVDYFPPSRIFYHRETSFYRERKRIVISKYVYVVFCFNRMLDIFLKR